MKSACLYILLLFHCLNSLGQSVDALKKQGDIYFNNLQYTKALEYYKGALELRRNFGSAQFQVAECYRLTMEFELAERYYGIVASSFSSELFPLARYYFGLMKKMQGKYKSAEKELRQMTRELKQSGFSENPRYRPYYKQALVEIAGCKLALNENKRPSLISDLQLVDSPVNSPYNDFAAVCMENDSSIIVSSARKESKGIHVDFTYGEYYTDFFQFQFNGKEWITSRPNDRFPSMINTRWGEGSGSYLGDHKVFYFTSCTLENETCFIYKTEKKNGSWNTPELLNENINQPGFNSKHPFISASGDTLYFSSNKEGGYGGFDIWFSVKNESGEFGPSKNLGEHLNTFLDEISPFCEKTSGVLFFASNGHKGFGGYDIFMAKGKSFDRMEVFNIGLPFNSFADDCFFTLGSRYGYLSSNRDLNSKFNIFMFRNVMKSNGGFTLQIESKVAIAGRESLYQKDYNYDSPDVEGINRIISQFLANKIAGSNLSLTREDQIFYDNLSLDDKDRIQRIVNARYRKMTESDLRALRVQEYFAYNELGASNREIVDEVVYNRLQQSEIGNSLRLGSDLKDKYDHLDSTGREIVDQIITNKVVRSSKRAIKSKVLSEFSAAERSTISAITKSYFKHKASLDNLPLRPNLLFFLKDNKHNQSLWTAIREQTILLAETDEYTINDEDRRFFQVLSETDLEVIKKLASAFVVEDIRNVSFDLLEKEIKRFDQLNLISHGSADRILARFIHNSIIADYDYVATKFGTEFDYALSNNDSNKLLINELLNRLSNEESNKDLISHEHSLRLKRLIAVSASYEFPKMVPTANHSNTNHISVATDDSKDKPRIILKNYVLGQLSDKHSGYQFINISGYLVKQSTKSQGSIIPVGLSINGTDILYETYTDVNGNFEFEDLPAKKYIILALNQPEEENIALEDLSISGFDEHLFTYQLNSVIYFNSGESNLRPEAKAALADIAQLIKENPTIKIEFHGHTDNVGDKEMNETLSKERSEMAFHYLTSHGATPQKIMINFHGLSNPVSDNTSPYGRQFNRRVEIKIQSNSSLQHRLPGIYLVKPHSTLHSISQLTGMEMDEIMKLNGMASEDLKAYQPIRLFDKGDVSSFQELVVELNNPLSGAISSISP